MTREIIVPSLKWNPTTLAFEMEPDTDLQVILGRLALTTQRATDWVSLAHYDKKTGATGYAIAFDPYGAVYINAVTGRSISLQINEGGQIYMGSTVFRMKDDFPLAFGSGSDTYHFWSTAQTVHAFIEALDDTGMTKIITKKANRTKNHDHASQSNPTEFIHSATDPDTDNTEWVSKAHDGTDAIYNVGKGAHTFIGGWGVIVGGKLEVDDIAYFDSLVNFYGTVNHYGYLAMSANTRIRDTNGNNDLLLLPTAQTAGQHPIWGLGTPGIVMLTKQANIFKDHDHAAQSNPTFIVHSATDPDTDNAQWRSECHDTNDSVSDVGKGGHVFKVNGVNKYKITELGGRAVWLTNKSGAQIDAGQIAIADSSTDDSTDLSGTAEAQPIGVAEKDVADDAAGWFVKSGIADVAMEDNTAATRGNWVKTSDTEAGYADATNAAPPGGTIAALEEHMREVGHCIESVAAGGASTHILARCMIHFN